MNEKSEKKGFSREWESWPAEKHESVWIVNWPLTMRHNNNNNNIDAISYASPSSSHIMRWGQRAHVDAAISQWTQNVILSVCIYKLHIVRMPKDRWIAKFKQRFAANTLLLFLLLMIRYRHFANNLFVRFSAAFQPLFALLICICVYIASIRHRFRSFVVLAA